MILGFPVDLTNKWNDLKQYIRGKIAALSVPITKKNVSFATKTAAYLMTALPAIIYPAKILNTSIAENEDLFRPLDRFLRRIAKVKASFPRALLYMRRNEGGLRLMDIIMQIQKLKQQMLQRVFKLESPAKQASKAIIERYYRQSVLHSDHQPLRFGSHIKSWIGSMLQYNQTSVKTPSTSRH